MEFPGPLNKPSPGSNPVQNFMNIGTTFGIRNVLQQLRALSSTSRLEGDAQLVQHLVSGQFSS